MQIYILSSNSFRQLKLFLPEIFPATLHEKIAMHAASMLRREKSNKFLKEVIFMWKKQ